jgi:serine/threonine-protein kinase
MTLMALNLKTQAFDTLLPNAPRGWYLPTGRLVAVQQDGTVRGGAFDLGRLRLTESPVTLLSGVLLELGVTPELAVSNDGTLIYLAANQAGTDEVIERVDRAGNGRPLDPGWVARFTSLALSPDGRRLAVSTLEGTNNVLWVKQLDTGPLTRLSFGGNLNYRPAWRPDGRWITFISDVKSPRSYLFQTRADGSGKPERVLLPGDTAEVDEAEWSPDGAWLVYRAGVTAGFRDIFARRVTGDSTRVTISAGPFDEYMPALSPDGRWVAYVSVESGREEVYVRPFPETGRARWQVSTAGGSAPAWAHSGRELFYIDRADTLIAAGVSGAADFQVTARRPLFSVQSYVMLPYHRTYEIGADDQSFLMLRGARASTETRRLTVVLNWFPEVEARIRQGR